MNRELLSLNPSLNIIKYYRGSYFRLKKKKKKKGNVSNILKDVTIVNGWNRTSYAFNQRQFHLVRVFPRIRHKAGQTFFTFRKKKKSGKILDERFQMNLLLILCRERMKKKKQTKKKEIKNTAGEKIKIFIRMPKFLTLISQIFNLFRNFR